MLHPPLDCKILAVPVQEGAGRMGCEMGPAAFRAADLAGAITELGHSVRDLGTLLPAQPRHLHHDNPALEHLPEVVAWIEALTQAAYEASAEGFPIFVGGDHSLAAGSIPGLARRAQALGKPFFVLWLDAHPDFHTLESTTSGHLHGTPVAYFTGLKSFDGIFPPLPVPVDPKNVCMMGIRSVDAAERAALRETEMTIHDMRAIDDHGIAPLLSAFLKRVEEADGLLHVSFDVDFLDPSIAPGVGTPVVGGPTLREAHLLMEMLHESGRVTSLDLVELNPFLDERGRTALLMVDLVGSLMGRSILDRSKGTYR